MAQSVLNPPEGSDKKYRFLINLEI